MSQRRSTNDEQPVEPELSETLSAPTDEGISLEQLGESYANLAGDGELPYEPTELTDESLSKPFPPAASEPQDDDRDACCPVSPTSIVEAILFVGHPENEPISSRHIASLMRGVRSAEVDLLIQELNECYHEQACPYQIETSASGYRLVLLEKFAVLRENFYGRIREAKLNQAAIEALATVAYNQPIDRAALKQKCDPVQRRAVTQLIRRGLVSVEKQGAQSSSMVYRTTSRFLQMFGLASLNDLPQPHDLEQN
jgi:segregation and condensation protein B